MSLFLNKTTEELLLLPKRDIIAFLVEEAKCRKEEVSEIMTMPKRDVIEFLIQRLRGRSVNVDYNVLMNHLISEKNVISGLVEYDKLVEKLSSNDDIMEKIKTVMVKTVYVNFVAERLENVASIEVYTGNNAGDEEGVTVEQSTNRWEITL